MSLVKLIQIIYLSNVKLEAICRHDIKLTEIREICYLKDVIEMAGYTRKRCKTVFVCVMTGLEDGPCKVRENGPLGSYMTTLMSITRRKSSFKHTTNQSMRCLALLS